MNPQAADEAAVRMERFAWPPRPLTDAALAPAAAPRKAGPRSPSIQYPELADGEDRLLDRLRRGLRDVEAAWFGFHSAPLPVRAAAVGWQPDHPSAYCPRCGLSVGDNEVAAEAAAGRPFGDCPACRQRNLPWERVVRLGEHAGLLRDLVHEVKFTAWRQVGDQVGRMLGRSIAAAMAEARLDARRAAIVPMPTTYTRRMVRGIDHALVIARGVAEVTGVPIVRALDRSHRRSQRSVPVSARAANVAGSIRAVPGLDLSGRTVIVVDDVKTTGATMATACRALRASGGERRGKYSHSDRYVVAPRIWAAVAAVAPRPDRRGDSERDIAGKGIESA